mmetsp:Transcript_7050/g.16314  ORF Transcript_7050/g.16314 Transcript_7050/m.16314 type:complete len:190 (+) Transcript_7050:128-697(+)
MSIAEFYIENGIDPCDPNSLDDFLAREHDTYYSTGVAEVVRRDASSRTAASLWPLNESELDYSAETRGWDKIYGLPASPPMASYRREGVRLNFWLTTGTVGSYLEHPRQGKTQLFRRHVTMSEASEVFNNPRKHTGRGYHTNGRKRKATSDNGGYMRLCAGCGRSLETTQHFSNNQRRKGAAARCRACV